MLVLGTISRSTRRRAVRAGAPARATRRSWRRSGWPPRCAPEGPTPTPPWRWTRWAGTSTGSEAAWSRGPALTAAVRAGVGESVLLEAAWWSDGFAPHERTGEHSRFGQLITFILGEDGDQTLHRPLPHLVVGERDGGQ